MKTKLAQQNAFLPLSNIIHIDVFCQYIIIHCHTWWNRRNRLQRNCTGICFYTLFLWNGIIKTVIDLGIWLIVPTRCIKLGKRSYIFLFIWPLCLKELVKRKISGIFPCIKLALYRNMWMGLTNTHIHFLFKDFTQ